MTSRLWRASMAAGCLLALARPARAQTPRDSVRGIPAACTYMTCALRFEPAGFLATPHLLRGAAGERVGSGIGLFGGGVDPLLAGPDSAAMYARRYVTAARTASVLGLLGTVTVAVALSDNNWRTTDPSSGAVAAALVGTALSIAAIPYAIRAGRSVSRSVWWYNAALPR